MSRAVLALSCGSAVAQQAGQFSDFHLPLPIKECTKNGGCHQQDTTVVLDANWRYLHNVNGTDQCQGKTGWSEEHCPDAESCSKNCALEGIDEAGWKQNYGVTTVQDGVKLMYVPGSRMYLLDSQNSYKMFSLKNKEFTLDIDASTIPCGVNGALYFSEMKQDGAMRDGLNTAGAEYGTGYCDAQCPRDIKFVDGYANTDGNYGSCCPEFDVWEANSRANAYTAHPCNMDGPERVQCAADKPHKSRRRRSAPSGMVGCCSWSKSSENQECGDTTPYCAGDADACGNCGGHWIYKKPEVKMCCSWAGEGELQACGDTTDYCKAAEENCGNCGGHWVQDTGSLGEEEQLEVESSLPPCDGGKCDQPGCDFNSYRNGARKFYGEGSSYDLDSSKPFTVTTRFITSDGTDDGDLVEITRSYVQDGKIIRNPEGNYVKGMTSLKDDTCAVQKTMFNHSGTNEFRNNGGLMQMGDSLERGMVLALSIWDDGADHMHWLDAYEPEDPTDPYGPGAVRGPCPHDGGVPKELRKAHKDAYVIYSNIRHGEIGSTQDTKYFLKYEGKYCQGKSDDRIELSANGIQDCGVEVQANDKCSSVFYANGGSCRCVKQGATCVSKSSKSGYSVYELGTQSSIV